MTPMRVIGSRPSSAVSVCPSSRVELVEQAPSRRVGERLEHRVHGRRQYVTERLHVNPSDRWPKSACSPWSSRSRNRPSPSRPSGKARAPPA